jgi:Polyketide cyclase / dehydrase and lipid transport
MEFNVSVDVAAPPELVFDLMADARNEPAWNSQVSETDLTSAEPIGAGSTFRTVNRGREYVATITEYDRPRDITFRVVGKQMEITGRMSFVGAGVGTHLDANFAMRPQGPMKVMLPLMAPLVRRDFPKQFASFKQFCEARAAR